MSMSRKRRGIALAAAVPLVVALASAAGTSAASAANRHVLPGTTPAWANAHRRSGAASGSEVVQGRVWLQYNNAAQALALAKAVSNPASPSYRHFISAAQFNARFRPTDASVAAVTAWLKGAGLTVTSVPSNHRWVDFSGTSAKAGSAFGVSYGTYKYEGHVYAAPSGNASVPAGLSGQVLTVTGLDTMPHVVTPARSAPFPPSAGFRNGRPCSAYYGEKVSTQPEFNGQQLPYAVCGYTPAQLRAVYGQGDLTGAGVTVAITDAYASPTIVTDITTYVANNDPANTYASGQYSEWTASNFTHGQACGGNGWYGEQTLDVEAVHAIAPAANIRYYGAASCYDNDLDAAIQKAMDDGVNVITNSWGEPELSVSAAAAHAESNMFAQAAATGISVLFSSGDDGDEAATLGGTKSADLPAASPWVTAVGGTSLGIAQDGSVALETGWGTSKWSLSSTGSWVNTVPFLYGAGGGTSTVFDFTQKDAPSTDYQAGDTTGTARVVPDIGLDADPTTGMLVGQTQRFGTNYKSDAYGEYRIGGTSLASPLFAGVMALAVQAHGGGLGLVNPAIYANQGNTSAIRDVTHLAGPVTGNVRVDFANGIDASAGLLYSVRTFDQDSSLATTAGYDMVTGVGAPTSGFAAAVAGP